MRHQLGRAIAVLAVSLSLACLTACETSGSASGHGSAAGSGSVSGSGSASGSGSFSGSGSTR